MSVRKTCGKSRSVRRAAALAATFGLSLAFGAPVAAPDRAEAESLAAPAATEKSRVPFRVRKTSSTCPLGTLCRLDFIMVQQKRRFDVRHVSCATVGPSPSTPLFFQIGVHKNNVPLSEVYYPTGPGATSGGSTIFVLSADTFEYVNAGETLFAIISSATTVSSLNCTVTGEMVKFGKKKKKS